MWRASVRNLPESAIENIELYPTGSVASALFDLRDHIVSHGFTEFSALCSFIETECSKVHRWTSGELLTGLRLLPH